MVGSGLKNLTNIYSSKDHEVCGNRSFNTVNESPIYVRVGGKGKTTLKLIEELGLQNELIFADSIYSKKRYILRGGVPQLIPISPLGFLNSKWTRKIIWPVLKEPFIPKTLAEDESIRSFITRRFSEYVCDTLVDPLVLGIYGGNTSNLSIKSCFPDLWKHENISGSVLKGAFNRFRT